MNSVNLKITNIKLFKKIHDKRIHKYLSTYKAYILKDSFKSMKENIVTFKDLSKFNSNLLKK